MAVRAYTYVDDLVGGICTLMQSDSEGPIGIGSDEYVTLGELVLTVLGVSREPVDVRVGRALQACGH